MVTGFPGPVMLTSFDEIRRTANRALDANGAAPGIAEECSWACAWLEAAGYDGLAMMADALDETPIEARQPSFRGAYGIVDLGGSSAVFCAPGLVELAEAEGRVFANNVKHGLYVLPFAVRSDLSLGCPVDPGFAIGGKREKNPYRENIDAAIQNGLQVDKAAFDRIYAYSRNILVPETEASRLTGAGAGLTDND